MANISKEELMPILFAQSLILLELFEDDKKSVTYKEFDNFMSLILKYSIKNPALRLRGYVEEIVPCYSDEQFKTHFRMERSSFYYIFNIIKPYLIRATSGHRRISPEKQFLIAIWKMATPDSYRSICEKFNVGRSTALNAVRRVIKVIIKFTPCFIKWPQDDRIDEIHAGFAAVSAFPRVIGAIDGTHINIKAPHINSESYVNRKGHHSIQLQAVCDHKRQFTYCLAGHVGSVHDQRVFRLSEVHKYLDDVNKFPNDSHLVGDAAYTLHKNLITPYRDNGHLTARQKNFNFCHSSTRITIERTFALLKGRFRSLLTVLDMERIDLIPQFIIACCTLHNICLLRNDEIPIMELNCIEDNNNNDIPLINRAGNNEGLMKRDVISNSLIMQNV